jgi:predicted nucleic acid-binding protein
VSNALDSSVLIPALVQRHPQFELAHPILRRPDLRLIAHATLETFSALTGGAVRPRVRPVEAARALRALDGRPLTLSVDGHLSVLESCGEHNILGGAIFDALIAATAMEHGVCLITRDERAVRTYDALGAEYELIT